MMLLCACENYLDLTPKGATLLDNLTEIEYLLNVWGTERNVY